MTHGARWSPRRPPPRQAAERELRDALRLGAAVEEAELIVALGGDGFMLQTLHAHARARGRILPVFGMNLGTVGFLMNEWRLRRPGRAARRAPSRSRSRRWR